MGNENRGQNFSDVSAYTPSSESERIRADVGQLGSSHSLKKVYTPKRRRNSVICSRYPFVSLIKYNPHLLCRVNRVLCIPSLSEIVSCRLPHLRDVTREGHEGRAHPPKNFDFGF